MSGQPDIIAEIRRCVKKAENDFRNAEYVLTLEENCPFDSDSIPAIIAEGYKGGSPK